MLGIQRRAGVSRKIVIALIGAGATVLAAVIGILPYLLTRPAPTADASTQVQAAPLAEAAEAGKPPLTLSYRKSKLIGQGMVVGLTNRSDQPLRGIVVVVRSGNEPAERSYRVHKNLAPHDSISVGWAELDGWKLHLGDRIRIGVDGYDRPLEDTVP